MPVRLTETAISKAVKEAGVACVRRDLADAGCPGLRLRITPPSRKSRDGATAWTLTCRDQQGRMRRFPLGRYPDMGIAEARKAARATHTRVKHDGADPVAERRRERAIGKAAKEGIGTLGALLDLYGRTRGAELKSWIECDRRIRVVFKPFLTRPLATLTARDIQLKADGWASAQSAAAAVRYLRPILKWAAQHHHINSEVVTIHPPATVKRRARVLSRDELAALLPVLHNSDRPYAAALRFMLLTLARREEVGEARWRDVDLSAGTWTIRETKNGQPHVVPLPRQALALLRGRLLANAASETIALDSNAFIFATRRGNMLANWDRETKALQDASGTADWNRHDLRRTGATMLGELGELPDIVEAALNHVSIRSPLAATYNRSRYRPQVAAALQRLADVLDGIDEGSTLPVPPRPAY